MGTKPAWAVGRTLGRPAFRQASALLGGRGAGIDQIKNLYTGATSGVSLTARETVSSIK